jgi:hypothetical protein
VRARSLLIAAALLAACGERAPDAAAPEAAASASPPEPAAAGPAAAPEARIQLAPPVTPEGYGPVRIGMSEAEARQALGAGVNPAAAPADAAACHFLSVGAQPPVLLYMVEGGKVTRVTVRQGSPARTDKGVGVGDTEAQVRAAYPSLETEPHKYVEGGKDLFAWTEKGRRGVRFELDAKGVVTQLHAGDQTIAYVEGCS